MSIELIVGPMFSGKSTELIRRVNRLRTIGKPFVVYNSVNDDRYGLQGVYTHNQESIPSQSVSSLRDQMGTTHFVGAEYVFIEEAQFFNDLYSFVKDSCEIHQKHVIVIGLNGDSDRRPFGQVNDLIPLADDITMLKSLCSICKDGTPGIFSKRIVENSGQICVGSIDSYIVVCRSCFS